MFTRDLVIYSGSIPPSGSAEDRPVSSSTFKQVAKWEIDPDDPTSVQFRIPSQSFGGSNDRIAFYISGSGKVGIGTKDPETAFDVRDTAEDVDDRDTRRAALLKVDRTEANELGAAKLKTARTIGGVSFNGTSNINLPGVNTSGNQDTTGNSATATKLATARTIGGVSFDGSANINLPGVNTTGNQDTSGNAATSDSATNATNIVVTDDGSSANHPITFIDDTTPDGSAEGLKASRNITINPNTGELVLGNLSITFTQGDGRSTFGTVTFTAPDAGGTRRTATISLR
jgi:hypothetical protein